MERKILYESFFIFGFIIFIFSLFYFLLIPNFSYNDVPYLLWAGFLFLFVVGGIILISAYFQKVMNLLDKRKLYK